MPRSSRPPLSHTVAFFLLQRIPPKESAGRRALVHPNLPSRRRAEDYCWEPKGRRRSRRERRPPPGLFPHRPPLAREGPPTTRLPSLTLPSQWLSTRIRYP